jgi:hypothetical protein
VCLEDPAVDFFRLAGLAGDEAGAPTVASQPPAPPRPDFKPNFKKIRRDTAMETSSKFRPSSITR